MKPLSVNSALDSLGELQGVDITVEGILRWEFEHYAIDHFPKTEMRDANRGDWPVNGSSIWLEAGMGSLQFNEPALERWNGKRVVVEGTLYGPDPKMGGCGHLSGWPACILARTITRQ